MCQSSSSCTALSQVELGHLASSLDPGEQQRFLTSFLLNFGIADVPQNVFSSFLDSRIELFLRNRFPDLEYADDVVLLSNDAQVVQYSVNCLGIEVSRYGRCFAPLKGKTLLRNWQRPVRPLTLWGPIGNNR